MTLLPYPIRASEDDLRDLRRRLGESRWADPATHASQGIAEDALRPAMARWREGHDWRRCEAELNRWGSTLFRAEGVDIHLLHARSTRADALPLLMTHGWPGSVIEFLDLLPALTDPPADQPAFHVVAPSLPGFGFSGKPTLRGWGVEAIADTWQHLMTALGYDRYVAQGGDWGAMVSTALLRRHPASCRAIHLNLVLAEPPESVLTAPTAEELEALQSLKAHRNRGSGYALLQATRPQSLGYALVDSPLGLAAFILDKFQAWTHGDGFGAISIDRLLDNLTLWWLTASAASAGRLYWESYLQPDREVTRGPVGCSIFPGEIARPSRRWAEARFPDLTYYARAEAGGHFAALEQPALFAQELRAFTPTIEDRFRG
jgi:epoxide hydrolase